ncbi:E3 SUMO-protein ligase PIAS3 isoform X2 [Anabrus simplex]|uniref:E3 SUMO-protein ligase PIAS3 isoform X2 n=1 Tax=Anabrus simplex TaxID=316456 RepID=UPI0034DD0DF5
MWKKQMAEEENLKGMIQNFHTSHLQTLLRFAGQSMLGNKIQLQDRATELVRLRAEAYGYSSETEVPMFQTPIYNFSLKYDYLDYLDYLADLPHLTPAPAPQPQPPPPPPPLHVIAPRQRNLQPPSDLQLSAPPPMIQFGYYPSEASVHPSEDARVPDHPDVTMTDLGFYDTLAVLLKPSYLVRHSTDRFQEQKFCFQLSAQQADDIITSRTLVDGKRVHPLLEVQLRLCNLDVGAEQDDAFPPSLVLRVNTHVVPLLNAPTRPGSEPKQIPGPVNITAFANLTSSELNHITISWSTDLKGTYAVAINLVRRVKANELAERLKQRRPTLPEHTTAIIQRLLAEDAGISEIGTTSQRVSLCCPISRALMELPCRATTCNHVQCFDGIVYVFLNEKKPTWQCPICGNSARFNCLEVDGYFLNVISDPYRQNCQDIELNGDGSWSPILPTSSMEVTVPADCDTEIISDSSEEDEDDEDDDDDDDDEEGDVDDHDVVVNDHPNNVERVNNLSQVSNRANSSNNNIHELIDLTCSDSDDDQWY